MVPRIDAGDGPREPGSPGVTPAALGTPEAAVRLSPSMRAGHSCQSSPMRSPHASHTFVLSPNLRVERRLSVTEREDFANTISAMREFCEQRRLAKQRADHELRLLQRELPLEDALAQPEREQVAGLIDRFTQQAVGALTRPVCLVRRAAAPPYLRAPGSNLHGAADARAAPPRRRVRPQALVSELQELRARTLSPLVTRLLFSISPVLRRTLTESELELAPAARGVRLHPMAERQECSLLRELSCAQELEEDWEAIRRRRASQLGQQAASPLGGIAPPAAEVAEGASAEGGGAALGHRSGWAASAGSEPLLCRVCEQAVPVAAMEEHMGGCMLDVMAIVSGRRLRDALRHLGQATAALERRAEGQRGAAEDDGAPGAPADEASREGAGGPLPLLRSCAECCGRALGMLGRADGCLPRQACAEEGLSLVRSEFAKLERLGSETLPEPLLRLAIEATEVRARSRAEAGGAGVCLGGRATRAASAARTLWLPGAREPR